MEVGSQQKVTYVTQMAQREPSSRNACNHAEANRHSAPSKLVALGKREWNSSQEMPMKSSYPSPKRPRQMSISTNNQLCQRCSEIPWHKMHDWKDYKTRIDWRGIPIADVDKHYRNIPSSSTCSLCHQLHAPWIEQFIKDRNPERWKKEDVGDQLTVFLNLRHFPRVNDYPTARKVLRDHDAPCHIAVVPKKPQKAGKWKWRHELLKHLESNGMVIVMPLETQSAQLFIPLQVSKSFNQNVVQQWLKKCKDHKNRCKPKTPKPEVKGMKVVDCNTRAIRYYKPGDDYVALSYVWGSVTTETKSSVSAWKQISQSQHTVEVQPDISPPITRIPLRETQTKLNFIQTKTGIAQKKAETNAFLKKVLPPGLRKPYRPAAAETTKKHVSALPKDIPLTIQDAILVTKALGYQYLWIDKYCIDQENKTERQEQCGRMGDIYAGSQITIFALGHNSDYGLPGVSSRPRLEQRQCTTTIGQYEFVSTLPDPHFSIQRSKWSTRAWTHQEGLFSTRRLFFTDHQVYYECNGMNCAESFKTNLAALHTLNGERLRAYNRAGIFVCGNSNTYSHVEVIRSNESHRKIDIIRRCQYQIQQYSQRELTHNDDVLEAFAGIAHFYARTSAKIFSVAGIPMPSPLANLRQNEQQRLNHLSYALAWIHDIESIGGSIVDIDDQRPWLQSWPVCQWSLLNPNENAKPQPRNGFPSWSWAGWIGAIRQRKDLPFCWNSHLSSVKIGFQDGSLKDYNSCFVGLTKDCAQHLIRKLLTANALHFDAYVLNHEKMKFWRNGWEIPSGEVRSNTVQAYLSEGFCSWEELKEKLKHGAYESVVLGTYGAPDKDLFRAIKAGDQKRKNNRKHRLDLIERDREDREALICLLVEHVEGTSYRRVGLLNVRLEDSIEEFTLEGWGLHETRRFTLV